MKLNKQILLKVMAFCFLICGSHNSLADYVVQKGDTLSEIAKIKIGFPVYKVKTGTLEIIKKLNPQISDPNRIKIGEIIFLSDKKFEQKTIRSTSSDSIEYTHQTESTDPLRVVEVENKNNTSRLGVSVDFEYSRIDSTDKATKATSVFLSKLNLKHSLFWDLEWSESMFTRLKMSSQQETYLPDPNSNKVLQNAFLQNNSISFSFNQFLLENILMTVALTRRTHGYSRAPTVSTLILDQYDMNSLEIGGTWMFLRRNHIQLLAGLDYQYILGNDSDFYLIDVGSGYQVKFGLEHHIKEYDLAIEGRFYFEELYQNTLHIEQKKRVLGAGIFFEKRL